MMTNESLQSGVVENQRDWSSYWNALPKQYEETDFLRQVERTVAGEPASEEQTRLTIDAVAAGLKMNQSVVLLDVCCGNGLLTKQLAACCGRVIGLDFSVALLDIAKRHHSAPNIRYVCHPATDLNLALFDGDVPSIVSMCDSFQYFTAASAGELLLALRKVTNGRAPILLTGVPDAERLKAFYNTPERWADYERRRRAGTEAVGTWWSRDAVTEFMREFGYRAVIMDQDERRFTAHYRFDVLAHPIDPIV